MIRWQPREVPQGFNHKVDKTRLYSAMHETPAPSIFLEEVTVVRTAVVTKERRN